MDLLGSSAIVETAIVAALAAGAPWWFSVLERLMGLRQPAEGQP